MIKIAVQTGGPEELFGVEGAYRVIKEAGFDGVDANIDHLISGRDLHECRKAEWVNLSDKDVVEVFKPWKDAAVKYGLDNYQAHAPFPSYVADGNENGYNEWIIEMLRKCIIGCDSMNCRNLIIHPFFLNYTYHMDPQTEWDLNIESYAKLIPTAKEYGVKICLENMFGGYKGKVYQACCSDIADACRYIDTLNIMAGSDTFGFCLDTGHLLLLGKDIKREMIRLGNRIAAFHVHDNNGQDDQHVAPYMGILDWNSFVEGLKAIGYDKTMSFETFNVFNVFDKEVAPEMLKVIAKTGRVFAQRAQA